MQTISLTKPCPDTAPGCPSLTAPAHETMAGLLQLFGHSNEDCPAAVQLPVQLRRLRTNNSLTHEGAAANTIFFVRSGTFKVYRMDEDGYERVLGFATRREVLGFDALCMASYPASIQALEDSTVYAIPRREISQLSQTVPLFALVLQRAGSQTLAHSRDLVDILAAVASDVRLSRFLIHLSQRMAACGQSPHRFSLRLGRREIASLLGMAHETASRCFTSLAAMGMLRVNDREVEILDMSALKAFSRRTRRPTEDAPIPRHPDLVRTSMHQRRHQQALAA